MILDQLVAIGGALASRKSASANSERRTSYTGPLTLNSLEAMELFGGLGDVWSGEEINHRTSLTYAAYWRAIHIVGNGVGGLPLKLQRNTGSGSEVIKDDPRYRLMRYKPNPWTLAQDFLRTRIYHGMDWGNGYAYIVRRAGKPVELRQLFPGLTRIERKAGNLRYYTEQNEGGKYIEKELDPRDVFHIRGLGDDGIKGFDVVTYGRNTLGIGLAAQHHGAVFFKNGASPSLLFEHPKSLSPTALQNLRETIAAAISGLFNSHKPFVIEEGMKAVQIQADHQKSQFIELRKFEVRDIANITGVQAYMLGDGEQSAYKSLEQRSQDFLDHTLNPWLKQVEAEATDKLLTEKEQDDGYYFEFERGAIISIDHKTKVESAIQELNNGGLNGDEYRKLFNRPPMPNGEGKKFRKPANIGFIGEEPSAAPPPVAGNDPAADPKIPDDTNANDDDENDVATRSLNAIERDAWGRMRRRIAHQAVRAAAKPDTFMAFIESVADENRELVREAIEPIYGVRNKVAAAGEKIDAFFQEIRTALSDCSGATPDNLADAVKRWSEAASA